MNKKEILNQKSVDEKYETLDLGEMDIESANTFAGIGLPLKVEEDYVRLSDNILELNLKKRIKTIAVSSSVFGEGSSTIALNLAIALTKNRASNILLIDGNLRMPSLHSFLGVEKEKGLTEMLLGEITFKKALKKCPIPNMFFMTSGNNSVEAQMIFIPERFKQFVNVINNHFDFVIFDSPPINQYPDSTILSTLVDGVLLVIQAERVIYEVIQKAKEKIENNGGTIIGAVLNRRKYYIPDMIYRKL